MANDLSRRQFFGATAAGTLTMATVTTSGAAETRHAPVPLKMETPVSALNTPALLLDVETMAANLRKMSEYAKSKGVGLRPHTKTHKCPIIAGMQMEEGAVGVCCAKVSEAEVMLDAGLENILITSPVVTPEKIERVIALAKRSGGVQMVLDNKDTAKDFNDAAKAAGITLRVLIDLDTGTKRTGIPLGDEAVDLAKKIAKLKSLQLDGVQAYSGHLMHVPGHHTRSVMAEAARKKTQATVDAIKAAGVPIGVVSGGGTGTFDMDSEGVYTDLQTGSYPFMDVQYREIGDRDGDVFDYFEPSLFVLVTAISQPMPGRLITVDAGYKAFASDSVTPEFADIEGLVYGWGGDEHGICRIKNPSRPVNLGDKFKLIVSHCDPTVNLYDYIHPVRDGKVSELWPVSARGRSQ